MENLDISADDLNLIRCLKDFDLIMLLSDIDEHRWPTAKTTLDIIREGADKGMIKTIEGKV